METEQATQRNIKEKALRKYDWQKIEYVATILVTAFIGIAMLLASLNSGPLWRDEVNSINVAQMPTWGAFWKSLVFESFPALWLLLLRFWDFIGFASSDFGIRLLGLGTALSFLVCLWACSRWTGARSPTISLALLGSLPTFLNIIGATRAYGLALCFLVLTFGLVWRVLESPSRPRMLCAGVVAVLFAHVVYYDLIFLAAILFAGTLVSVKKRHWRTLGFLMVTGLTAVFSMSIYIPLVRSRWPTAPRTPVPYDFQFFWSKVREAVSLKTSAQLFLAGTGFEIWVWVFLCLLTLGLGVLLMNRKWEFLLRARGSSSECSEIQSLRRCDLALFSGATMVCGAIGYVCFLFHIKFWTERWYYIEMLALMALCMEVVLNGCFVELRSARVMRTGFLIILVAWGAGVVWGEAHVRHSNLDLIATALTKKAAPDDLILVAGPFEAITFSRYYRGRTEWTSIPPVADHELHRSDLIWKELLDPNALDRFQSQIKATVQRGRAVWVAGVVTPPSNNAEAWSPFDPHSPSVTWLGFPLRVWGEGVAKTLLEQGCQAMIVDITTGSPVNYQECLPLIRFTRQMQGKADSEEALSRDENVRTLRQ